MNLVLSLSILEVGRRVMREVVLLSSKSQRNGKEGEIQEDGSRKQRQLLDQDQDQTREGRETNVNLKRGRDTHTDKSEITKLGGKGSSNPRCKI